MVEALKTRCEKTLYDEQSMKSIFLAVYVNRGYNLYYQLVKMHLAVRTGNKNIPNAC